MMDITDISVEFLTASPIFVWLGLLVLLGLSFLLYRRTNPPLPMFLRVLLGVIRLIAVVALMAALSEPVISYSRDLERVPRLALLLDQSASMAREERGRSRFERLDSILASDEARRLGENLAVSEYYFGGNLTDNQSDVASETTALGTVLKELERRELSRPSDHWLLFSDGNSNSGPDPVEVVSTFGVPISTIGLATGGGRFDIAVTQVDFNSIVYVGQPTEMTVRLGWDGAESQTVPVQLVDGDKIVAEARQVIDQAAGLAEVKLRYVPDQPGQKLLQVRLPELDNEAEPRNNARTVSVKVLKSRLAVLLATSGPDYEVGFLRRFLDQSDRYDVELVVLGSGAGNLGGRFPGRQTDLNRYDLIILHDPRADLLNSQQVLLRSYLAERGGAVWILMGPQFAERQISPAIREMLPFYPAEAISPIYRQTHGLPDEGQLFHPAVRIADTRAGIRDRWADLPPFKMIVPCEQFDTDGVTLVYTADLVGAESRLPLLGYRRLGPGKLLALAGAPLWTWGFEPLGYGREGEVYRRFLEGTIRWLTVQDDFDPVRIVPEKEVFSRGQTVRFDGYAYDQGFRPIPGVTGMIALTGDEATGRFEADLLERGEGHHVAEFTNLPPGRYAFEATFIKEGQVLKTSRGSILVESFSLEEYNQQGDPTALAAISRATGGYYYGFEEFSRMVTSIDFAPVHETISREFTLFGKLWLLLLFVGALALEWVLRKLNYLL
jgi:hypothetical protein